MNRVVYLTCAIIFFSLLSCKQDSKDIKVVLEWHDSLKTIPKKVFFAKDNEKNLRDGVYKTYREDGTIMNEINMLKGLRNGMAKYYYPNGELFYVVQFAKDVMHGDIMTYSKKGDLVSKGTFCNGEKCGEWIYYNKEGDILSTEVF